MLSIEHGATEEQGRRPAQQLLPLAATATTLSSQACRLGSPGFASVAPATLNSQFRAHLALAPEGIDSGAQRAISTRQGHHLILKG
jgi:hypothetical protein